MAREIEVEFTVKYRTKVYVDEPSFDSIADAVEIPEVEGVSYEEDTFEICQIRDGLEVIYEEGENHPIDVDEYFQEEARRDQKQISD